MKPQPRLIACAAIVLLLVGRAPAEAQDITVSAADPSVAAQGTVSLDVRIAGKGFKRGAVATFLRSGTTDPDGIQVNSTTYVSATELIANIDVSSTASLDAFDIEVSLQSRTGKGSELFRVTAPVATAGPGCTIQPSAPEFELVGTLNSVSGSTPEFQGMLGLNMGTRLMTLTFPSAATRSVQVAAVASDGGTVEIFLLDPATGARLDGTALDPSAGVQPHITLVPDVAVPIRPRSMAAGDVNADGVPDFAIGDQFASAAFVLVGSVTSGILTYSAERVPHPAGGAGTIGWSVAMGDLDGTAGDELALGLDGTGSGKKATGGTIELYKFPTATTPTWWRRVAATGTAALKSGERFNGLAIGDVTGDSSNDIVGGVGGRDDGATDAGAVYVFAGSGFSAVTVLRSAIPRRDDRLGFRVAIADVDGGFGDAVASTSWGGSDTRAEVFPGLVTSGTASSPSLAMRPLAGLGDGWTTTQPSASDLNGDGLDDVVIGAPNAGNSGACVSPGAAYVYISTAGGSPVRYLLQPPQADVDFGGFGWSVGTAPGSSLVLVGEHGRNLGSVVGAGQVYVYKYTTPQ